MANLESASAEINVADNHYVMTTGSLPAAFAHLRAQRNLAADAALAEALPHLMFGAQQAALQMLVRRGHVPSLAKVVGQFRQSTDLLKSLLLAQVKELSAALRAAAGSSKFELRASALDMVIQSGYAPLAYLLADALRLRCRRTRALAAEGLRGMAAEGLGATAQASAANTKELSRRADALAEALGTAVARWETHFQPAVLEAAAWMGDRLEPTFRKKIKERRSKIIHPLIELVGGAADPRLAGFVVRALGKPELSAAAVQAISRSRDEAFFRAVIAHAWLLGDPAIERGARRIPVLSWLKQPGEGLARLDQGDLLNVLRWLSAIGGPSEWRLELFRQLLTGSDETVRSAVVWHLITDSASGAADLLGLIAVRGDDPLAAIARREVRRRGGRPMDATASTSSTDSTPDRPESVDAWQRYWELFDAAGGREALSALRQRVLREPAVTLVALRAKLSSGEGLNRARALHAARDLGVLHDVEEYVYRLAHDADPMVRARAVGLLTELPGPTAIRILRAALNDADARVQANAVEALDQLDWQDRAADTKPKLESPHPRVRANAVKSLLRVELAEAGAALLDMLEDDSQAHRLGALWVVERLHLRSLLRRIVDLSHHDPDEKVRRRAIRVLEELRLHPVPYAEPSTTVSAATTRSRVGESKP